MDLKIFAKTIEPEARAQVERMAAAPIGQGSKIRIMPDCHAGAGCTIGTTMTITDKVCPNLVGVDIACGVMLAYTDIHFEDRLKELDRVIRQRIPCGRNVHDRPDYPHSLTTMHCWGALSDRTHDLAFRSLGTLGGGNHFIEAYKGGVLCVHTGSRNIGLRVANYYQDLAKKKAQEKDRPDLAKIEPKDRQAALSAWKASRREMDDLAYLEGEDLENYLHDCAILNAFAVANRQVILSRIVAAMGGRIEEEFDTVHNYIDTGSRILRKGAVSAEAGKLLAIPLNMRDGVLVCRGKGNPDWNHSAPHGAGRLYSRKAAKRAFTVEEYAKSMEGIFTTCIGLDTLDEAPFAYKDMREIMECIEPTVEILERLEPVYNFKAGED
jgi:RNA-splicing ligase RtcB